MAERRPLVLISGETKELPAGDTLPSRVNVDTTQGANVGTGEDVIGTGDIDANMLAGVGKAIRIIAWGTAANNANAKTARMRIGPNGNASDTLIGSRTLAANLASTWMIEAYIVSTGADAQKFVSAPTGVTATGAGFIALNSGTLALDEDAANFVTITGDATSNNDIVLEGIIVEPLN